jgi:ArsR family metal-binding transcriptional regulator
MAENLIETIEITHTLPCLADPAKIRFHAQASADLADLLPYLNATVKGAIYNPNVPALTFTKEGRIICLHQRLITGAKIDDVADARAVCDWLTGLLNTTWRRRDEIEPSYERRARLTPLDIYKLLPRTNCRRCRTPTCLAFANELANERLGIMQCAPIFEGAHQDRRRLLLQLLNDAGYDVPSAFRPSDDAR